MHAPHSIRALPALALLALLAGCSSGGGDEEGVIHGGEASLVLPTLDNVSTAIGATGHTLLIIGMIICVCGLGFGILSYSQLRSLPVHHAMLKISELIYTTCKAYLTKQGKFLMILWVFITVVIVGYYKFLVGFPWSRVGIIVFFSLLGMAGSYAVAWFGIRVNTFANSRTAFASLRGKPLP
ncbi:MAG: sodium/proton-translocating pyrophosphatase, partial [Ancrocorticia sp.]|nr:sodium/proton-translocating pyrophosphatase [Ancrocorticia sp.]